SLGGGMGEDGSEDPDDLPPPYRPWQGTGVPQPGADRPSAAPDVGRRGRVPPPPVPPAYPASSEPASPQWYAPTGRPTGTPRPLPTGRVLPGAPAATARPARARVDRSLLAPILALLAAGTAWLPWLKSPVAGLFDLSGSGLE